MENKSVIVVILSWNGKHFLEKFLPGVIEHSQHIADIAVADNGSSDGSLEYLRQFRELKIIPNPINLGFAKGYNEALKNLYYKYFMILNSDVEVTENWLDPLLALMEKDEQIAACQPKMLTFDDRSRFEYAGAAGGFIDRWGYPFCQGRIFHVMERDTGQYNLSREIFWASGACMMVRSDLFRIAGGFDDDFFAHQEEIDLCWRLKNMGHKIIYCPDSVIYHVGAGTLQKSDPRKTYLNFRNNLWLMQKNLPSWRLIPVFLIRLVLDFAASIKFFCSNNVAHGMAVVRAYVSFISSFFRTHSKRYGLQNNRTKRNEKGIYSGSIVMDFYVRKKESFSSLEWR